MDDRTQVNHALVRLLSRREHAALELIHKLTQKGFEYSLVIKQIDEMNKSGMQSDYRYVEMLVRTAVSKGHGINRVRQQLSQWNIETDVLEAILSELDVDWYSLAYEVKCKKFGEQNERDFTKRQKQQRFLLGRGFTFEEIKHAIDYKPYRDA